MVSRSSAFASGTTKNLHLQWRTFIAFCLFFQLGDIPASLNTICVYAQFLSRSFSSVDSVRNYLHGVKVLHVLLGYEFKHLESIDCRLLLRGLDRTKLHHVKQALPITPHILAAIFRYFDMSRPLHVACWVAFLFAFFTMSRKANIVPPSVAKFDHRKHLSRGDVMVGEHGLLVYLSWSKTNQLGKRNVFIPLPCLPNSFLCPVLAYKRLLSLTPCDDLLPAFSYSLSPRLQCLTEFRFVNILRSMLRKAGFRAESYSGHSFRRGGATFAFKAKVPGELIKLQGDWASDAYLRYLDFSLQDKVGVTVAMGNLIQQYGL